MKKPLTISVRQASRLTGAPEAQIVGALNRGELGGKRMSWGWLVYPDKLEEWVGLREPGAAISKLPPRIERRLRARGL